MLRFIHGYDARYWPGLERHGLLNRNSGIKIHQHFATPADETFNVIAAAGGTLHRLVREHRWPFYVDRLLGGTFYRKYDFDPALLRAYGELLGEWFLGIQMHEWASALNANWNKIRKQLAGTPPPWSEQQIHDAIKAVSPCPWCLSLSCGTPAEFSRKTYSATRPEYLAELRQFFLAKQAETAGLLLPCDSYELAPAMEFSLGARAVMPEVGAQIGLMRLQVAAARGLAKAHGRRWGTYYEPWGGNPFGACRFFEEPFNEWRLDNSIFPYDFSQNGPHGGSSRALQRRICYYSLLAGAHFFSEEWGISNTFYNWRDYALTPYGEIKKEFIDFADSCGALEPFVPYAIVLPREFEVIDLAYLGNPDSQTYLCRELDPGCREAFGHIRNVLRLVYARCGTAYGNEGHVMTNSRFGDLFDIIDEDAGDATLARYAGLVDASADGGFASRVRGRVHRVLTSTDLEHLASTLDGMMAAELPCVVRGNVHWLLDRSGDRWLLALFNNEGIERGAATGDRTIGEATVTAGIAFRHAPAALRLLKAWPDGDLLTRQDDHTYGCRLPAGSLCLIEFAMPESVPLTSAGASDAR